MDKYHIYEEIGKGECSQVFKGREKRKIEYVAIKRVDKTNMAKTVNEVQIMHKLQSPHILKFHDWYETKNNLWLILEYCTGADLQSLLAQDDHLPEASLKIFALDILSGLKYMHGLGIVHCDIRPKNFLIDEHGIVKFSNFKYARKVGKISKLETIEARGYPAYMAPELFDEDGVHSYSSDLWSFGCILYVFRTGSLPWNSEESIDSIARKIKSMTIFDDEHENLPFPSISSTLVDLISWLLEKSPIDRCNWENLCSHPFWSGCSLTIPSSLPSNLAFEEYISTRKDREYERIRSDVLKELGLNQSIDKMNLIHSVMDIDHPLLSQTYETSKRLPPKSEITETKAFSDIEASNVSLRFQQPVVSKLLNPLSYNHTFQHELEVNVTTKTVREERIKSIDNQLFHFQVNGDLVYHSSDFQIKPIIGNKLIEEIEKFSFKSISPLHSFTLADITKLTQTELESHLTLLYKSIHRCYNNLLYTNNSSSSSSSSSSLINQNVLGSLNNLLAYLGSISTSPEVSNIVLNTSFLNILVRLARFHVGIPSSFYGVTARNRYSGANSPTNSSALPSNMVRYATFILPPSLKTKDEHIFPLLMEYLSNNSNNNNTTDIKLKRRAIATLGEMVFYVTAQDESELQGDSSGSKPLGIDKWEIPPVHNLIWKSLMNSDEITKHYAAKTVENILAQGNPEFRPQFQSIELAQALIGICVAGQTENLIATCVTALSHMFYRLDEDKRLVSKFINIIFQASYFTMMSDIIREGQPRAQISILNLLNLFLVRINNHEIMNESDTISFREQLLRSSDFVALLGRVIEMSNVAALRAKSIICIKNITCHYPDALNRLSETRCATILNRLLDSSKMLSSQPLNIADQATSSYLVDAIFDFIKFLRVISISYLNNVQIYLKDELINHLSSHSIINKNNNDQVERSNQLLENKIRVPINLLTSIISMISGQGSLRKVYFSSDCIPFAMTLTQIIVTYEKCKSEAEFMFTQNLIKDIDHSVLVCLEILAKIDFEERCEEKIGDSEESLKTEFEFIRIMCTVVFPLMINYTSSNLPELRMVIVSCIRNIFTSLLNSLINTFSKIPSINAMKEVQGLLDSFFKIVPSLLEDFSPIPQYVIRLVHDLLEIQEGGVTVLVRRYISSLPKESVSIIFEQ